MAWLGTWRYRVKADIDYTNKIGASVTQFPLTIFIKSSSGVNGKDLTAVFNEVGSNYQKIAVTKSDGTTQLYVEVEQWDATNKLEKVSKNTLTLTSKFVKSIWTEEPKHTSIWTKENLHT